MKKRPRPAIQERFGFAVKVRREEMGFTQEDLAEKAGIHRTYLSDVERGARNLSLVNIEKLAAALALPISDLFRVVERA
jgi:transcriptional regulator with XRE-family HTH domain